MTKVMVILKLQRAAVTLPPVIALLWSSAFPQDSPESSKKEEQKLTCGADSNFSSAYVWRCIVFDNRSVMQPSAWVSASGFTLTGWTNLPLTNTPERAHLYVTDLALTYRRYWKKLRIEPATWPAFFSFGLAMGVEF